MPQQYGVEVRDHVMIAHSFRGDVFGPAQRLHGATYVVDVAFHRTDLDEDGIVVDIGRAIDALRAILAEIAYRNLDEVPHFAGRNTTTEFLSRWVWSRMAALIADGALGQHAHGVSSMRVTLSESHVARAWYEAPLGGSPA